MHPLLYQDAAFRQSDVFARLLINDAVKLAYLRRISAYQGDAVEPVVPSVQSLLHGCRHVGCTVLFEHFCQSRFILFCNVIIHIHTDIESVYIRRLSAHHAVEREFHGYSEADQHAAESYDRYGDHDARLVLHHVADYQPGVQRAAL